MRSSVFNRLTVPQQAEILVNDGFFLHTRTEPEFVVDMYELEGLYVEIYYHKSQRDFVVIKSFYSSENEQPDVNEPEVIFPLRMSWRAASYTC
jgi:hypothetical protein